MIFAQEAQEIQDTFEQASIVGRTLRNGEYQVQRMIRQTSTGKLFLAMHTVLMIPLALKQMPADEPLAEETIAELDAFFRVGESSEASSSPGQQPERQRFPTPDGSATNRFAREALFLVRYQHTAIPTLYDYFFEDGYWYLVIDSIPGYTLSTYLRQRAPFSALEALNCALQICDALVYLHAQHPPVLLPDLAANDIMLTPSGMLMLVNFGLDTCPTTARKETDGYKHNAEPSTATPATDEGIPPQQHVESAHPIDTSPDLYRLGTLLRAMLYGIDGEQEYLPAPDNKEDDASGTDDHSFQHNPDVQRAESGLPLPARQGAHLSTFLTALVQLATRGEKLDRFESAQTFYLALQRAYQIEEQRTFQERLAQSGEELEECCGSGLGEFPIASTQDLLHWEMERSETPPISTSHTLELEQRQIVRAAIQRVRQERLQQKQVEVEMESVDKSLEQRSSMGLPQVSLQTIAPAEAPSVVFPIIQRFQRIVKINFVFALTLCLILASLLVYIRVTQPLDHDLSTLIQRSLPATNDTNVQNLPGQEENPQNSRSTAGQQTHGPYDDLSDNYWQALPPLPAAEADNTLAYVELQGRAYVYMNGGYHSSPPNKYDHALYRYDIRAAHWETVSKDSLPGMVNSAAAVDEQGHIFFSAGYSSDSYTVSSLLYMYDPGTALLQKIVPPAQMLLGFAGSLFADRQGHLYISQGFMSAGDAHAPAGTGWYRYDIATGQWHHLAPLPVGLGYTFTASDANGGILLLGGASDAGQQNATDKIYRYDIASDSWTQARDSLPQAMSGAAGCQPWPGQLALVGGYDAIHNAGSKNAWLLDLHTLKWRALVDLTIGGSVLGAAACDGKGHLFLERGTSNPRSPTSDYWELLVAPGIKIES